MDYQSITALNIVLGNNMNELMEENKRLKEENEKLKKKKENYFGRLVKVKTWLRLPPDIQSAIENIYEEGGNWEIVLNKYE